MVWMIETNDYNPHVVGYTTDEALAQQLGEHLSVVKLTEITDDEIRELGLSIVRIDGQIVP